MTTTYVYDGPHVIAEYENNTLKRRFIYGPGIDEPVCMIDLTGANPVLYFYYYDGLGSVVALSNTSGTIAEQYRGACPERSRGNAFGNTKVYDGSATPVLRTPAQFLGNPTMFTARRRSLS